MNKRNMTPTNHWGRIMVLLYFQATVNLYVVLKHAIKVV